MLIAHTLSDPLIRKLICKKNLEISCKRGFCLLDIHFEIVGDDRLCGLVVRVLGYRSGGPGSIPGTTKKRKSSGSGTGSTQPREYN
jgi:hypothetical protein